MELERIGPYRIVRKLGQGGTGTVFEAVHEEIARSVAIKVLRGHGGSRPELTARFLNEARAVNIIRHRSIVGISDLGRLPDGSPYIVMEHLDGVTLRRRAAAGLPLPSLLRLCRQVASALAAAHDKGIIHRARTFATGPRAESIRGAPRRAGSRGLRAEGNRPALSRGAGRSPKDGGRLLGRAQRSARTARKETRPSARTVGAPSGGPWSVRPGAARAASMHQTVRRARGAGAFGVENGPPARGTCLAEIWLWQQRSASTGAFVRPTAAGSGPGRRRACERRACR